MDDLADFRQAIQDDLTIGDESPLFPVALINRAINRAYQKSATLVRWPQLEDAKKTSTQANQEYYDYPSTWRPDSIWHLEIDSVQYGQDPDGSPLAFEDYVIWRQDTDNANSTDKKWANHKTRFFVFPVPTLVGSNNIHVWGIKNITELSGDTSETIFTGNMPECNEAIVLEAKAILKSKGEDEKSGQFASLEAKAILLASFNKIKQEQHKYERNQPMFYVTDMFSSRRTRTKNTIGNFSD